MANNKHGFFRLQLRALLFLPMILSGIGLRAQTSVQQVRINAPYVQTPPEVVLAMLEAARVTREDIVYDLGCGDGRIVIEAARKYGARAVGIDLNPDRIKEAQANASSIGVSDRVSFIQKDFFDADLGSATVVTLYLLPEVNRELLPRLLRALKPGTRIVSHAFDFGEWQPEKMIEVNGCRVFLWVVPVS
jgi:precorrin-6B methylase 2